MPHNNSMHRAVRWKMFCFQKLQSWLSNSSPDPTTNSKLTKISAYFLSFLSFLSTLENQIENHAIFKVFFYKLNFLGWQHLVSKNVFKTGSDSFSIKVAKYWKVFSGRFHVKRALSNLCQPTVTSCIFL